MQSHDLKDEASIGPLFHFQIQAKQPFPQLWEPISSEVLRLVVFCVPPDNPPPAYLDRSGV
jgi:hypothetical protein